MDFFKKIIFNLTDIEKISSVTQHNSDKLNKIKILEENLQSQVFAYPQQKKGKKGWKGSIVRAGLRVNSETHTF